MATEDERCADAKKFRRINDAFHEGDLQALRAAVDDPAVVGRLDDNGETLLTEVRIDRRALVSGLFYGVDGMQVGGTRRLEISPHLAYGDRGVPGVIPAGAVLIAEITILEAGGATP
jgi:FKBP-type peptidyl-prolyl cis-trans isomerase 2